MTFLKKLRIAQLCTPWESCPPPQYGGTELVVYNLCQELSSRGHRVTLYATGDSRAHAKIVSVFPRALYRDNIPWTDTVRPLMHTFELFRKAKNFDIIHNHFHYFGLLFSRFTTTPVVTTYHGDFATAEQSMEKRLLLEKYKKNYFVSISRSQKKFSKIKPRFIGTVYNGIECKKFPFNSKPENYLAWLGRITEKKGVLDAIQIARQLNIRLLVGAKIDIVDREFYEKKVKRFVDGKKIIYLGELNHVQKVKLLKNALALLNPISWNEPFGLVMIEAMACGTPVIAYNRGAAPEIVQNGITGFIVHNQERMKDSIKKIQTLSRAACRKRVEKYFSSKTMADGYEKIYYKILGHRR